MGNLIIPSIMLLFSVAVLSQSQSNMIRWEPISKVSSNQLLPSGKEDGFIYYIARGSVRNQWLNGKSLVIGKNHYAYVPFQGREAEGGDFQVLVEPRGTLSWMAVKANNLPNYWIAGGTDPSSRETTFICRAFHGNHLIIGRGAKSTGSCLVGIHNKVYKYNSYEVLALNDYGIATGAAKVPKVPGPIFLESRGQLTQPMTFRNF